MSGNPDYKKTIESIAPILPGPLRAHQMDDLAGLNPYPRIMLPNGKHAFIVPPGTTMLPIEDNLASYMTKDLKSFIRLIQLMNADESKEPAEEQKRIVGICIYNVTGAYYIPNPRTGKWYAKYYQDKVASKLTKDLDTEDYTRIRDAIGRLNMEPAIYCELYQPPVLPF